MSSLFTRIIGTVRFEGTFLLRVDGIPLDFHLARKKDTRRTFVVRDIFFLSLERFLETLHFNLSGGQIKETMVQKSTSRSLIFPSFSSRSSPVFSHLLRRRGSKGNVVNHSKFKIRGRDRDCRGVKKMQSDL